MIQNNEENREKLARQIVEDWDLDTLMDFAIGTLDSGYETNNEAFQNDWKNEFGEEE
jgi:hypothetical protein